LTNDIKHIWNAVSLSGLT